MIALHDYILSSDCYKVRLLLAFLALEYRKVRIDVHPGSEHLCPAFLAKSPLGALPVLEDEDVVLHDAEPILVYLAMRYDPQRTWMPADAADAAHVCQWLQFAGRDLAPLARRRDAAIRGAAIDPATADASQRALTVLDDRLAEGALHGRGWLVGAAPTIADIAAFGCAALAEDAGVGLHRFPAVWRWVQRFRGLPRFLGIPGVFPDLRGAYAA